MNLSRRSLLKAAVGMPAAAWLLNYRALAAPFAGQVKITNIKTMGLDNVADGCLIRIETDAGIVGYGEAGLPSAAARARVDMMVPQLIGQDPFGQPRAGHDPPGCRLLRRNYGMPQDRRLRGSHPHADGYAQWAVFADPILCVHAPWCRDPELLQGGECPGSLPRL